MQIKPRKEIVKNYSSNADSRRFICGYPRIKNPRKSAMNVFPKKKLGQNFLIDPNIRRKIIEAAEFNSQDIVLEIGSGRGELTSLIAEQVKKVYAVEIDKNLSNPLSENLKNCKNVEVFFCDILKFNLEVIFKNISGKVKVFGNIPYYITTPIIELLLKYPDNIKTIFLTVQKEFAERVVAQAGDRAYGSLSCFIQYYALAKKLFVIKKGSFFPVPNVDSCFLSLSIRDCPLVKVKDENLLFKLIRASFNQRRKTLKNSLSAIVSEDKLQRFFGQYFIPPKIRPEDLSLTDFANLANMK